MLAHEQARELMVHSFRHWRTCFRALCLATDEDAQASRQMLLASHQLQRTRSAYDRAMMLALPQAWAKEYDVHWHQWLEWNHRLNSLNDLVHMTSPYGPLDQVWQMCGVKLLALD